MTEKKSGLGMRIIFLNGRKVENLHIEDYERIARRAFGLNPEQNAEEVEVKVSFKGG